MQFSHVVAILEQSTVEFPIFIILKQKFGNHKVVCLAHFKKLGLEENGIRHIYSTETISLLTTSFVDTTSIAICAYLHTLL